MAEILRLHPVVRVERVGPLPVVSVRPAPHDVPAMQSFETFAAAELYAPKQAADRGWRFIPAKPHRARNG